MKTTINLPDSLFTEAKREAVDRKITMTQLFEQALRRELLTRPSVPFRLKDGSFKGEPGLQPGIDLSDWARIKELMYEDDEV